MTITVSQRWQGAKLVEADSSTAEAEYIIRGTDDEVAAQAALDSATALVLFNLVKKSVSVEERLSENAWGGTVKWGQFEPKEIGDSTFTFDTGGGSAHVQTSIATLSATPAPGVPAAPDFQNAIGVTDSGVEGIDITAPAYTFSESHIIDAAAVTAAYKATLFSLTGAWNNAAFKGFDAGEVMFMGASGNLRDYQTWEINFKFSAQPNFVNLAVGPIVVPLKRGWDYLWVRFREVEDAPSGHLARVPIAAYVEQVAPSGNLSLLGI